MNPLLDGVDHINIYSKGQTELGRWLSNFTRQFFICDDGEFCSIEGYWYWLLCSHKNKEKLRDLHGYLAKKVGRELGTADWPQDDTNLKLPLEEFKKKIKTAMEIKLYSNLEMEKLFKVSTLPFTHYYTYGTKVIEVPENNWVLEHWETLRGS